MFLAALALLGACGQQPSALRAWQQDIQLADRTAEVRDSMNPCRIEEGSVRRLRPYRDCVDLLPQERMRGVWYRGSEESNFIPNATAAAAVRTRGIHWVNPEFRTFLEVDPALAAQVPPVPPHDGIETHAWLIDFVGRRARSPGTYYTDEADHLVVLDRLISIRLLGPVVTRLDPAGCTGHCPPPLSEQ